MRNTISSPEERTRSRALGSRSGPAWLEPHGRYESALVLDLPADLRDAVLDRRRDLGLVEAGDQLEPHLTVCFLGRMMGAQLARLADALAALELPARVPVALDGVGCFRRGRVVTNVHLRVRPEAGLCALHQRVLEVGRRFPWFAPGRHVGPGWTPHISIADRVELTDVAPTAAAGAHDLVHPHLIGVRLDSVSFS